MLKIAVPSGKCPITLDDPTREGVVEWAKLVRAKGLKNERHYTVEALVYWSREFECVDPRDVKEWLTEEWPEERPLSPAEWRKLMGDRNKTKAEKAAEKKVEKETKSNEPKPAKAEGSKKRWLVFGTYPVTGVLRWMGKQGMTFEQARRALSALECEDVNDTTLRIQLRAGSKGERGEPANLTPTEAKVVAEAAGEVGPKPAPKDRTKYTVLGFPAVAVCRTLGAKGWEFDAVTLALETLGCKGMSHATMRMHFTAGQKKNNRWGEPAKLTKKHMTKLIEASK